MKKIKKIISAVLVLTAIAVFAAPVFAEEIAPCVRCRSYLRDRSRDRGS
ncbi:MAG: hypothetical protein ACLTTQ_06435 [Christensenellales bacterium]